MTNQDNQIRNWKIRFFAALALALVLSTSTFLFGQEYQHDRDQNTKPTQVSSYSAITISPTLPVPTKGTEGLSSSHIDVELPVGTLHPITYTVTITQGELTSRFHIMTAEVGTASHGAITSSKILTGTQDTSCLSTDFTPCKRKLQFDLSPHEAITIKFSMIFEGSPAVFYVEASADDASLKPVYDVYVVSYDFTSSKINTLGPIVLTKVSEY